MKRWLINKILPLYGTTSDLISLTVDSGNENHFLIGDIIKTLDKNSKKVYSYVVGKQNNEIYLLSFNKIGKFIMWLQ